MASQSNKTTELKSQHFGGAIKCQELDWTSGPQEANANISQRFRPEALIQHDWLSSTIGGQNAHQRIARHPFLGCYIGILGPYDYQSTRDFICAASP